jgi:hypothetical protein
VTAAACSRTVFAFLRDPEGPNLVVVLGLGALIYILSLAFYLPNSIRTPTGTVRLVVAILIQITVSAGLYLFMR